MVILIGGFAYTMGRFDGKQRIEFNKPKMSFRDDGRMRRNKLNSAGSVCCIVKFRCPMSFISG